MDNLQLKQVPIAKTGMLIRKPVADVFEAFINPDITTKFWFTKSSGRLEAGKQVQWDWEMYGISIPVTAKAIEPNKRIVIEWPGYGSPTTVEWIFAPHVRSRSVTAGVACALRSGLPDPADAVASAGRVWDDTVSNVNTPTPPGASSAHR